MKQATEYFMGLGYKLCMMRIPVDEPTCVYGDNQSVLSNTTIPESTLKNKTQIIAFRRVREGTARDEWRTVYINMHENVPGMITKHLPSGDKRCKFVHELIHHL